MWDLVWPFLAVLCAVSLFLWLIFSRKEPPTKDTPADVMLRATLGEQGEQDKVSTISCSRCAEDVPAWFVECLTGSPTDIAGTTDARLRAQLQGAAICRVCTESWRYPEPGETEAEYVEAVRQKRHYATAATWRRKDKLPEDPPDPPRRFEEP